MLAGFLPSTVSPVFHMLHLSSLFLHWFLRVQRRWYRCWWWPCGRWGTYTDEGFPANHITHANLKIWVLPKIVGFPPKSSIFNRFFHYKPSILGYPYFWKHPYRLDEKCILCGMKMRNLFQSVSLFYSCKIQTKYQKTTAPLTNKLYNRSVDVNKDIHKRGICLPKGSSKVDRSVL